MGEPIEEVNVAETAKGNKFVRVRGYTRADDTKVRPHDRSTPRDSKGAAPKRGGRQRGRRRSR
jgi:hypothetical protein